METVETLEAMKIKFKGEMKKPETISTREN